MHAYLFDYLREFIVKTSEHGPYCGFIRHWNFFDVFSWKFILLMAMLQFTTSQRRSFRGYFHYGSLFEAFIGKFILLPPELNFKHCSTRTMPWINLPWKIFIYLWTEVYLITPGPSFQRLFNANCPTDSSITEVAPMSLNGDIFDDLWDFNSKSTERGPFQGFIRHGSYFYILQQKVIWFHPLHHFKE